MLSCEALSRPHARQPRPQERPGVATETAASLVGETPYRSVTGHDLYVAAGLSMVERDNTKPATVRGYCSCGWQRYPGSRSMLIADWTMHPEE